MTGVLALVCDESLFVAALHPDFLRGLWSGLWRCVDRQDRLHQPQFGNHGLGFRGGALAVEQTLWLTLIKTTPQIASAAMSRQRSGSQSFVETAQRPLRSWAPLASMGRCSTGFRLSAVPFRSPSRLAANRAFAAWPAELAQRLGLQPRHPSRADSRYRACGGRLHHSIAVQWHGSVHRGESKA